jgi:hypothetical protein
MFDLRNYQINFDGIWHLAVHGEFFGEYYFHLCLSELGRILHEAQNEFYQFSQKEPIVQIAFEVFFGSSIVDEIESVYRSALYLCHEIQELIVLTLVWRTANRPISSFLIAIHHNSGIRSWSYCKAKGDYVTGVRVQEHSGDEKICAEWCRQ